MGKSEMTYAEAMAEIEAILAKMNEANPDIDALAGQVRRAGELIRFCRGRLRPRMENRIDCGKRCLLYHCGPAGRSGGQQEIREG